MREIKFRSWLPEFNKMAYGQLGWATRTIAVGDAVYENDLMMQNLMQSTGLHDKNGKEVHEGDIVNCSAGCPHEVFWRDADSFLPMPGWDLKGLHPAKYDWIGVEEVIGNIYQNPELLQA